MEEVHAAKARSIHFYHKCNWGGVLLEPDTHFIYLLKPRAKLDRAAHYISIIYCLFVLKETEGGVEQEREREREVWKR